MGRKRDLPVIAKNLQAPDVPAAAVVGEILRVTGMYLRDAVVPLVMANMWTFWSAKSALTSPR